VAWYKADFLLDPGPPPCLWRSPVVDELEGNQPLLPFRSGRTVLLLTFSCALFCSFFAQLLLSSCSLNYSRLQWSFVCFFIVFVAHLLSHVLYHSSFCYTHCCSHFGSPFCSLLCSQLLLTIHAHFSHHCSGGYHNDSDMTGVGRYLKVIQSKSLKTIKQACTQVTVHTHVHACTHAYMHARTDIMG
jgi:hypothetical protein